MEYAIGKIKRTKHNGSYWATLLLPSAAFPTGIPRWRHLLLIGIAAVGLYTIRCSQRQIAGIPALGQLHLRFTPTAIFHVNYNKLHHFGQSSFEQNLWGIWSLKHYLAGITQLSWQWPTKCRNYNIKPTSLSVLYRDTNVMKIALKSVALCSSLRNCVIQALSQSVSLNVSVCCRGNQLLILSKVRHASDPP